MNLSFEIIYDHLSRSLPCSCLGNNRHTAALKSCQIFTKGMPVLENTVYVCRGLPLSLRSQYPDTLFIICEEALNEVSRSLLEDKNYIGFDAACGVDEITNLIFGLFTKFSNWLELLESEIQKDDPLNRILKASFPMFHNTIILVSANLRAMSIYHSTLGHCNQVP